MNPALARRLTAEFTGTGLLVPVVVASGIAATRLTADAALRLLVNSLVTAMGLGPARLPPSSLPRSSAVLWAPCSRSLYPPSSDKAAEAQEQLTG